MTIRISIISAAAIAPSALIKPSKTVPGVTIRGVAARDQARATAFAQEHSIPKVFSSYEELLADPETDAVYNPLPNALHYEWTKKAIEAGKHVLLEKPSCSNAEETKELFKLAESKGIVLLEALHHRFHPKMHKLREIVQSGQLGTVQRIETRFHLSPGILKDNDIRLNYDLAGGSVMDLGTYSISACRFVLGTEPTPTSATPTTEGHPKIDRAMVGELSFPNDIVATLDCDMRNDSLKGIDAPIKIVGTKGHALLTNYVVINGRPADLFLHLEGAEKTQITDFESMGGDANVWVSYAYQLLAFINRINAKPTHYWIEAGDSVKQQQAIDNVYEVSGLGKRQSLIGL